MYSKIKPATNRSHLPPVGVPFPLLFLPQLNAAPYPFPGQCYVLGLSLASAAGQNFVYFTITSFNPLVCTTISTTRKFFTIVFSVLFFGHPIEASQWG